MFLTAVCKRHRRRKCMFLLEHTLKGNTVIGQGPVPNQVP